MNNSSNCLLDALDQNLQQVVLEIHRDTKAPIPSIVSAVLTVIALVCQGKIRIRKRHGLISPTSLWFIVILGSGERKSAVMNIALQAVRKFIVEQAEVHCQQIEKFENNQIEWKSILKGILTSIRKKSEKNEPTDEERQRLDKHNRNKPQKPKQFKLIHEKMSPQALIKNLSECHPTTGIISDEAATVLSSRGLSDMGMLNKGWDGSTILQELTTEESRMVLDPCITMALYVQQEIFDAFLQGSGALSRSVGLLSRCYVVRPPEAAGSRFLAYSAPASTEVIDLFGKRCQEILRSHIDAHTQELPEKIELYFSPDAQSRWEQEHDKIEFMMNPGGFFCNDKDFASKHADKIARLAALFHYFAGADGPIPLETLERSISISWWYAAEFVHNFAKPQQLPQEQLDANQLLVWLANYIRTSCQFFIKKNEVRQDGPNPLRNKIRLNAALRYLWQQGIACEDKNADNKTIYIKMNPQYFTPYQIYFLCSQSEICIKLI